MSDSTFKILVHKDLQEFIAGVNRLLRDRCRIKGAGRGLDRDGIRLPRQGPRGGDEICRAGYGEHFGAVGAMIPT